MSAFPTPPNVPVVPPAPAPPRPSVSGPPAPLPTAVAPPSTLPQCRPWRAPPPAPNAQPILIVGCVQAVAGYQCSPDAPFTTAPACQIPSWNDACYKESWQLPMDPNDPALANLRSPVFGCLGNSSEPGVYKCPNQNALGIDTGGGVLTVTSIAENCYQPGSPQAAAPPPPPPVIEGPKKDDQKANSVTPGKKNAAAEGAFSSSWAARTLVVALVSQLAVSLCFGAAF